MNLKLRLIIFFILSFFIKNSVLISQNLLDTSTWTIGSGSVSGFSQYGITSENSRILGKDHIGNDVILWKATPDVNGAQSGGFGSSYIDIDHTKDYRLSVWIKKTNSNDGHSYFKLTSYIGGSHHTLSLGGTVISWPAFWWGDLPKLDRWYLLVGYIHKSNHPSTINDGKIYDGVTGEVVQSITDYKFKSTATKLQHRAFLYGDTNTNDKQYIYAPRIEQVNGNEWSIDRLLSINPDSQLKFVYDNAGSQKQRFYCAISGCTGPPPPAGRAAPKEDIASKEDPKIEDDIIILQKEITLFPNPTKGIVSIKLNSNSGILLTNNISIYNSTGMLVLNIPVESQNNAEINLSNFSVGTYLIHMHLSNGQNITKQIIKN